MNYLQKDIFLTPYADSLLERFLRYVKIYSTSSSERADEGIMPSTPQERDFADTLAQEMRVAGFENVQVTDNCYIYGSVPATKGLETLPSFCLLAHIDTVEEVSGKDVQPAVFKNYDGKRLDLKGGVSLDPAADTALAEAGALHDTIITSDGTTLLGADDKAGVAEIMTAVSFLIKNPEIKHGTIEVIFSPDEETGHGMDKVPLNLLKSKMCYTVDGGHIGELETECFNAFKSDIVFTGKAKHTGTARPDMVNAITMASSFITNLPRNEMPETTDGYQGFYAPMTITGTIEKASVCLFLRDFTIEGMEKRKKIVELVALSTASTFGGIANVTHTQQYLNMKNGLAKNPAVVKNLVAAYKAAGITPTYPPIRGGTDGSRLTEMGIPTPNIFTGGHNYHSRTEWASFSQMISATEVLIQLARIWADKDSLSDIQQDNALLTGDR
jgi:tripeptide aminopeptidase